MSILFTDDQEIAELNAQYRGKDKPTDVLSFPQEDCCDRTEGAAVLGDVVISFETARRQALERGETVESEILRLLVHGVLHLAGYDHEGVGRNEAQRMRRKERQLLKWLRA